MPGNHSDVHKPVRIRRTVRRTVDRDGVRAQLVADVSIAVNTGGSSDRQSVVVRQHRTAAAAPDEQVPIDPEEQP